MNAQDRRLYGHEVFTGICSSDRASKNRSQQHLKELDMFEKCPNAERDTQLQPWAFLQVRNRFQGLCLFFSLFPLTLGITPFGMGRAILPRLAYASSRSLNPGSFLERSLGSPQLTCAPREIRLRFDGHVHAQTLGR